MRWVGFEWNNGDVVALHFVEVKEYTANISLQWFCERNMRLIDKPNWQNLIRFHFKPFGTFQLEESITPVYDKETSYYHKDIWDFYKAIGYDYKKKRYLK